MEIPDAASIKRRAFEEHIKQGTLFRLRGNEPFESEDYHVFIVLNANWQTGEILYLENGTTQLEKRKNALIEIGMEPERVSVTIPGGKYSFFSRDTLIDCHDVHSVPLDRINFSGKDFVYLNKTLEPEDLEKILRAVEASPAISPAIKRKIIHA